MGERTRAKIGTAEGAKTVRVYSANPKTVNGLIMQPVFSIIIPIHNVALYLRESLDSVIAQSFTNWEVICVNDGSVDESGSIIDEYAKRDGRFRVLHKVNAGVSAARNDAMQLATGEYICFLDGDDVWAPDWLMKVKEATQDGRADIVRLSFTFWNEERISEQTPSFDANADLRSIVGEKEILEWGWTNYTTNGHIWRNVIRRELIVKHGIRFPVGMKINEDIIFDLMLLPYARYVVQSRYAGYFYRMRTTSAWHSKRPIEGCTRYLEESIKLWNRSRSVLEKIDCLAQLRRNEAYMFYCAVLQWLAFGLKEERCRANEICELLKDAYRLGMMDLRSLPVYWRPAFFVCVSFGSFSVIGMTYRLLEVYHKIHNRRKIANVRR